MSALVLGVLTLALVSANSASAATQSLVLNHSMAGVGLGASVARLHQVLGPPKAVEHVAFEITGPLRKDVYGKLSFSSYAGSILSMQTTRRSIRTASGLGVGTTKRRLQRELPNLSCHRHVCTTVAGGGLATIGKRVTSFRVRDGAVRYVSIGRVID